MIRVLIVADVRLYREGVAEILRNEGNIELVGTAGQVEEALRKIDATKPGVVLLDLAMPDSFATARLILQSYPDIHVVALAAPEVDERIIAYAEAGFSGFVPRDGTLTDLVDAVTAPQKGELRCSPHAARNLLRRIAALAAEDTSPADSRRLTNREAEIAGLIKRGLTNKEIASELYIAVSTVKNHVHSILEKLHVHRRGEVAWRLRHAWFISEEPTYAAEHLDGQPNPAHVKP